jgi:hypothetical protein
MQLSPINVLIKRRGGGEKGSERNTSLHHFITSSHHIITPSHHHTNHTISFKDIVMAHGSGSHMVLTKRTNNGVANNWGI